MPHSSHTRHSGSSGDDLGSTDEVKVFKDEGEDEKISENLLKEDKSSLIDLTESEILQMRRVCHVSVKFLKQLMLRLCQTTKWDIVKEKSGRVARSDHSPRFYEKI
uniref:CTNNB1_binding domain-containing protein n=1 Tax=Glossina brevipalpis TaxID=37001 RepID=A0A1A9WYD7_9MUSC